MQKNLKRMLACVLAAVIVLCAVPMGASAAEYTEGDYTYTVENGEATITAVSDSISDVVIPDTLGGYPVVRLDILRLRIAVN